MQNSIVKLIVNVCLSFGILLIFSFETEANSSVFLSLQKADSLFEQQKFTKAQELYVDLLENEDLYSPRMLLRMAFIEEGQENYAQSLYYLNLHYHFTSSRKTLYKISKLASEQGLSGYESSDFDYFNSVFRTYYHFFAVGTLLLIAAILVGIYRRKKNGLMLIPAYVVLVIVSIFSLFLYNKGIIRRDKAIVKTEHAWAMSSPSAGGQKIGIVSRGNRIDVIGEEDIWFKIEWEGTQAYIRQSNLELVQ